MALVDFHYAFLTIGDSRGKSSNIRFRVPSIEAAAYFDALTQTLKDGTEVGQMLLSFEDMTRGFLISKGVMLVTEDDAADYPAPNSDIYNFDKITVFYSAGLDNYHITIPSRDPAAYALADDGVTLLSANADAFQTFISRFNALVLGKNGIQGTVERGVVTS